MLALFKRVVESTYQGLVSAKYVGAYCHEYVFRFNRRRSKSRTHPAGKAQEVILSFSLFWS